MAKDRIEAQEKELKSQKEALAAHAATAHSNNPTSSNSKSNNDSSPDFVITKVLARTKIDKSSSVNPTTPLYSHTQTDPKEEEFHALFESSADIDPDDYPTPPLNKRYWLSFSSENQFTTYLSQNSRRGGGEPINVPKFCMGEDESEAVRREAADSLKFVTEEYRKYRVRSEVARKELEGRLRRGERREAEKTIAQENAAKQNAIDSPLIRQGLEKRVEKMKNELAEQELQWKEAYDSLLKENEMLKSKGAEATLASQWRQRYEQTVRENEQITTRLQMAEAAALGASRPGHNGAGTSKDVSSTNYAEKYQQLRDEYSMYRKEAKKILESYKQKGGGAIVSGPNANGVAYLKNVLAQYLATADPSVRDRMEPGIFMAMDLTEKEIAVIKAKKAAAKAAIGMMSPGGIGWFG
ncbi:hypothetical protein TrST_g9808 [Triparma strigata]|uniref:GRIP domain-containing protein n=1 Tax=Triparma strigata TaxID=1606541 RepID=A0A9W7EZN9_9STRA|nr:hypothetical protein TrST_g9808 [Triparma strigata]